jgi:VanZ family protein
LDYPGHLIIVFGLMPDDKSKRYLPPLIWAGLIILGSSIPNLSGLETGITVEDKIVHFTEYFVLGFLVSRAVVRYGVVNKRRFPVMIMIVVAFGVLDELHQAFIPGRTVEMLDMAADILGALTSIMLYTWLVGRKTVRKQRA